MKKQTSKSVARRTNKPAVAPDARIARVAKGRRPQYFSDPAIDKLLWMTATLMEELSVTRDRLDTLERLLERRRTVRRSDIEQFKPDAAASRERATRRSAFVERVMRIVQAELEEVAPAERGREADEAVAAVSS